MVENTETMFGAEESTFFFGPGEKVGSYTLQEPLSNKRLSWIYKAVQSHDPDGEVYALKIPKFDRPEYPSYADLLKREGQSRFRLVKKGVNHHHLLVYGDVHYFNHELKRGEPIPFVVMEYLDGKTLRACIDESTGLSADSAFAIAEQVLEGLSELHKVEVVHRDLKPDNVMVMESSDPSERGLLAKIIDLGIAADMARNQGDQAREWFSPFYAAPEVVPWFNDSRPINATTDLFSFGILMYEMFTAQRYDPKADMPALGGQKHLPHQLDRLLKECVHNRFQTINPKEATRKALDMLKEARRTYERLKEAGAQDTDERRKLKEDLNRVKMKYETLVEVSAPLDKRRLCIQQIEDIFNRLGQPTDSDVERFRAALDEETARAAGTARECYEKLLSDKDWGSLERWENDDALVLQEEERDRLIKRFRGAIALSKHESLLEHRDWTSLDRWKQEAEHWLPEQQIRHAEDKVKQVKGEALVAGGDRQAARTVFEDLAVRGSSEEARNLGLRALNSLVALKDDPPTGPVGCLISCSAPAGGAILTRTWPKALHLGRGSKVNRESTSLEQHGRWSHLSLLCDTSHASTELLRRNHAISRRHLSLTWNGQQWHLTNKSAYMAVRLGGLEIPGGGSAQFAKLPDAIEFLMALRVSDPWETVAAIKITTIGTSGRETPPSLLLESQSNEIAAGLRWLIVGAPVPGESAFPAAFEGRAPFQILARGGRLVIEALEPGTCGDWPLPKGACLSPSPGETLVWKEGQLAFHAIPEAHEAFMED